MEFTRVVRNVFKLVLFLTFRHSFLNIIFPSDAKLKCKDGQVQSLVFIKQCHCHDVEIGNFPSIMSKMSSHKALLSISFKGDFLRPSNLAASGPSFRQL